MTQEEWVEKCNKVHNHKYDYSESVWTRWDCMVKIICPKHGAFWQNANSHQFGHGCKKCLYFDWEIDGNHILNAKDAFGYFDGELIWKVDASPSNKNKGKAVGVVNTAGYKVVNIKGKIYLIHRIIWEMFNGPIPEGMQIDHIDRNRLNNHLWNLRLVTPEGNSHNLSKMKNNTSGVTGVHKVVRGNNEYWAARIDFKGKGKHLGYFKHFEDAVAARKQAEKDLWEDNNECC